MEPQFDVPAWLRKTALEAIDEYNAYKRRGILWPTLQSETSTNTEGEQMNFANRCADQIESLEMSAERRMYEATEWVPEGMFRCCCGQCALLSEAMPASDNPYAMPICPACFGEAFPGAASTPQSDTSTLSTPHGNPSSGNLDSCQTSSD